MCWVVQINKKYFQGIVIMINKISFQGIVFNKKNYIIYLGFYLFQGQRLDVVGFIKEEVEQIEKERLSCKFEVLDFFVIGCIVLENIFFRF